jgi:glycine cleavage system H protein
MPTAATVVAHNANLVDQPGLVNTDPYGAGWLCLIRPVSAGDQRDLLDADGYRALIGVPADV